MSGLALVALISDMLVRATPLILTGLAVAVAFQAGVLNIGAEGQFLVGAAMATTISLRFGPLFGSAIIPIALLAGSAAGALWAAIAAELRSRFHVLEVISTIMLNFVAIYLISFLVRGPLQEPARVYPQTSSIISSARLPLILPGTRLHLGFLIAVVAGVAGWWLLRNTAGGFRLRLAGANPAAAFSAGLIDTERTTRNAFLISGALAGLAGSVEVHGVTFALYENLSPGYGYTAIAVALLAGFEPPRRNSYWNSFWRTGNRSERTAERRGRPGNARISNRGVDHTHCSGNGTLARTWPAATRRSNCHSSCGIGMTDTLGAFLEELFAPLLPWPLLHSAKPWSSVPASSISDSRARSSAARLGAWSHQLLTEHGSHLQ